MRDVTDERALSALNKLLERFGNSYGDASPALSQAARDLLAAMAYADNTLINSHLQSLMEGFRNLIRDTVKRLLYAADLAKTELRAWWAEYLEGKLSEDLDELGRAIERLLGELLKTMTKFRDETVRPFEEKGHSIENAANLQAAIIDLQRFKEGILNDWPWTSRPGPPVNRKMVAESRAAIARNEGEPIEELIRRLGGAAC